MAAPLHVKRLLALISLSAALPARAATFVVLDADPTFPLADGVRARISNVSSGATPGVVEASFPVPGTPGELFPILSLRIVTRSGAPLTPGSYTSEDPTGPVLQLRRFDDGVEVARSRCALRQTWRASVNQIGPPFGFFSAPTISADIEVGCEERKTMLRLAVRIRVGDADCAGAPNGSPCDDGDACSAVDACRLGTCVSGPQLVCQDDDPLTDAACDINTGCVFPPASSSWAITGTSRATAIGSGRTITRREILNGTLILRADGTYTIPASQPACPTVPDPLVETGTWMTGRHGRLELRTGNLRETEDVLRRCTPGASRTRVRQRQWVRIGRGPDKLCRWDRAAGLHLCGKARVDSAVLVSGVSVAVTVLQRFSGPRLDTGAYVPPGT